MAERPPHGELLRRVSELEQEAAERDRVERVLRASERRLQLATRITDIFLSHPDDQMYEKMLELVLAEMGSEFGTFGYFDERGAFVAPAVSRRIYWEKCNVPDKEVLFHEGAFGGIWGRAVAERRVLLDNDGPFRTPSGHVPVQNTIVAPVVFRGTVVSAIHLANKTGGYDRQDASTLGFIANQVAPVLYQRIQRERRDRERREATETLEKTSQLLELIRQAQASYIHKGDSRRVYKILLHALVTVTESEYGFLDEVLHDPDGTTYKLSLALSDISWDEASKNVHDQLVAHDLEFRNLSNLSGRPAVTGEVVISNEPEEDPRSGGLPEGHPRIRAFLGMPLFFGGELVGVAGVANREGGYTEDTARFLEPLLTTCAGIIAAYRAEERARDKERALRQSEERYRDLVEGTEDLIVRADGLGRFLFLNSVAERVFGLPVGECLQTSGDDFVHPEDRERTAAWIRSVTEGRRERGTLENRVVNRRTGQVHTMLWTARVHYEDGGDLLSVDAIGRDLTEYKALEARLAQAHKMESIGTLAGGIAHDFNNILYMIIGNAELALQELTKESDLHANVQAIKSAGLRASAIVKQLLSFSSKTERELRPVGTRDLLEETLTLLRSTVPATIRIHTRMPERDVTILADPVQIKQVLLNLCTNAYQALENRGGAIEVAAEPVSLGREDARTHPNLAPGPYLRLTVRDDGPGVSPEHLDRLFDPYFTTREVGSGSGMGLAVVLGIVRSHGGDVSVSSRPGAGATFSVILPAVRDGAAELDRFPQGSERILFIDDEQALVDMTRRMLERLGYTVTSRTSPVEALELFRDRPGDWDLVMTDMTMPEMTGADLFHVIKNLRRDIRVIICTGHSSLVSDEKARELGIDAFLLKPIRMSDMARTLRQVLDSR